MSPLREGGSQKVISQNIAECLRSYRKTGRIGNSRPKNSKEAREQCAAIAYGKARETNPNIPK